MLAAESDDPAPESEVEQCGSPASSTRSTQRPREEFGLGVLGRQAPSRETIAGVFRALRAAGQASGEELRAALAGPRTALSRPQERGAVLPRIAGAGARCEVTRMQATAWSASYPL